MIKKQKGEIPWWESDEDEEDSVKPAPTYEELKEALKTCKDNLHFLRHDRLLMLGWHTLSQFRITAWEPELKSLTWSCSSWGSNNCIQARGSKYKILSNEQKKDVIASLKGWVVQDDFDTTVSRLPPNIRHTILSKFASMIIFKDCLRLFFSNPFWYLDTGDEFSNSESSEVETPFGAQLHTLYKALQKGELQHANHWRAQTIRLANMTTQNPATMVRRDTTVGLANEGVIKSKAFQFAATKLEDKVFRCLLKDPDEDKLKTSLGRLYHEMAVLAKNLATSHPSLGWRVLDQIPTKFDSRSKVIEAAFVHDLNEGETRLNQHNVLAIFRPYFFRVGAWDEHGAKEERVCRAHVFVEDPIGRCPNEFPSEDEDAFPTKRTKRKAKKAKTEEDVEVRTKESALQGKAKKGTKKKKI
ncbi:Carboxylesterase type B [Penicillium mononematosum]|uniref:Carboxylesterase type B n=1 Tax=Penicillium mononematosum TaxID=268346 RepID=UPI0025467B99|nr:Carboxylesterase type B [Penicillium mononematosum]KAJ6191024.1 Carboxylesterase type B [Penicillium mononematosum]